MATSHKLTSAFQQITVAGEIAKVTEYDLLERKHQPVNARRNSFSFELGPFETKTFAVK